VIHPSAVIDPRADVADGVSIGPFSVVHGNVVVGAGAEIGSHSVIGLPTPLASGRPLEIGPDAVIRSHAVIYEGSTFGPGLETGHHVTLREGLTVGRNLRVGTGADLLGNSMIGDFVRLHSGVFICQSTTIGNFVWIYVRTVFTDDPHPPNDDCLQGPTIEDFAVVSAQCCVSPGVLIGRGAVVGAASVVTRDVAPGKLAVGTPARVVGDASDVVLRDGSGQAAYPWTRHFRRGYPEEITTAWNVDA
jgi:acetyltransferase-like isoleucine patch superfamily enzyme